VLRAAIAQQPIFSFDVMMNEYISICFQHDSHGADYIPRHFTPDAERYGSHRFERLHGEESLLLPAPPRHTTHATILCRRRRESTSSL